MSLSEEREKHQKAIDELQAKAKELNEALQKVGVAIQQRVGAVMAINELIAAEEKEKEATKVTEYDGPKLV